MGALILALVLTGVAAALALVVRAAWEPPPAEPRVFPTGTKGHYRATPRVRDHLRRAGVEVWEVERDRCVVAFRRAVVLSFATGAVCEVLWAPDGSVFEATPPDDPDAPWHLSRASRSTLSRLRAAREATP